MAGMPRRINDYPVIFAGWHGVSSLGHGFVLISFFFFFILFIDSKLKNETASILDLETFGVPKFKHRLGFYLYQINKLRFVKKNNLVHLTTGARRHDSLYTLVV